MTKKEELYRFEVILYRDSSNFGINFPEPHPFIILPEAWMGMENQDSYMRGLQVKGWKGIMTIQSSTPRRGRTKMLKEWPKNLREFRKDAIIEVISKRFDIKVLSAPELNEFIDELLLAIFGKTRTRSSASKARES